VQPFCTKFDDILDINDVITPAKFGCKIFFGFSRPRGGKKHFPFRKKTAYITVPRATGLAFDTETEAYLLKNTLSCSVLIMNDATIRNTVLRGSIFETPKLTSRNFISPSSCECPNRIAAVAKLLAIPGLTCSLYSATGITSSHHHIITARTFRKVHEFKNYGDAILIEIELL